MKTLISLLFATTLQGCAILTASPSLPAYISAHAAGVTAAATVGTLAVTGESLWLNTKAILNSVFTPSTEKK